MKREFQTLNQLHTDRLVTELKRRQRAGQHARVFQIAGQIPHDQCGCGVVVASARHADELRETDRSTRPRRDVVQRAVGWAQASGGARRVDRGGQSNQRRVECAYPSADGHLPASGGRSWFGRRTEAVFGSQRLAARRRQRDGEHGNLLFAGAGRAGRAFLSPIATSPRAARRPQATVGDGGRHAGQRRRHAQADEASQRPL